MPNAIRALIVDDDEDSRVLFSAILEEFGAASVELANSGRAALKVLASNPAINLMLCDLRMPDMDGVALLRELPPTGTLPAIVLISGVESATLAIAGRAGLARGLNVLGTVAKHDALNQLLPLLEHWRHAAMEAPDGGAARVGADELREALAGRRMGISVLPVINLATGKLAGVDVAPYWPESGVARSDPDSLLATAQRHDLLDELVLGLLDVVAACHSRWEDEQLDPLVFLPIYGAQLTNVAFPDHVLKRVGAHWLPPERVVFRFSAAMADTNKVACLDVISRLRVMRMQLALETAQPPTVDDLPFQMLWLEPRLVADLASNPDCRTRIAALAGLARAHEAKLVATGVQTAQQRMWLLELGCDLGQGALIAEAMSPNELADWVVKRTGSGRRAGAA